MDWYDSHVQRESLTKLYDSRCFAMFTENNCTDILAMPDGGAISTLKERINRIVESVVNEHIDDWFGATTASKSLRRRTLLSALGEAWSWYKTNHSTQPMKIGFRTGQLFYLNDDRV